jgi:pimeloyl-ACP methyl ester carboxylesterase
MTAVIFLPGIGVPAHVAYAPLMAELAHSSPVVTKELEVYTGDRPPEGYGLDLEVDGLDQFATGQGFDRFHLFGHSIGGAVALAYIARHPDRVASVALNEPGTDFSAADQPRIAVQHLADVPEDQRMQWFVQQLVRPGVELAPPPPSDDPEMAKRPAGVLAAVPAMYAYHVDEDDLRRYRGPAYFAHGTLSDERWEAMAERIPHVLRDCTVERYDGRHHIDAPHLAEPRRVAAALTALWKRAGDI